MRDATTPVDQPPRSRWHSVVLSLSVFLVFAIIFLLSPNWGIADSRYTILTSEMILEHGSFDLTPALGEEIPPQAYMLMEHEGQIIRFYPLAPSIFALPAVWVMREFDESTLRGDGSYEDWAEARDQHVIGSLLMALAGLMAFWMGRHFGGWRWGVVVAVASALGSCLWSTLAMAIWSDTWGVLFSMAAMFLTLRGVRDERRWHPVAVATLVSFAFFCKPSFALTALFLTLFHLRRRWQAGLIMMLIGAVWLGLFVAFTWVVRGELIPGYFLHGHRTFDDYGVHLLGLTLSPSRGLLIFTPWLLILPWLHWRQRRTPVVRDFLITAVIAVVIEVGVYATWGMWWGGWSYGPRLLVGTIPWFAAMLALAGASPVSRGRAWALGITMTLAVVIHLRGATLKETWIWSAVPITVDEVPARCFDWREPQFLAPLGASQPYSEAPLLNEGERVTLTQPEHRSFVGDGWDFNGWGGGPPEVLWAIQRESQLRFALPVVPTGDIPTPDALRESLLRGETSEDLDANGDGHVDAADFIVAQRAHARSVMTIRFHPHPSLEGRSDHQRVEIMLNDTPIHTALVEASPVEVKFEIPHDLCLGKNTLMLRFPDGMNYNIGHRLIGGGPRSVGVEWMEMRVGEGQQ